MFSLPCAGLGAAQADLLACEADFGFSCLFRSFVAYLWVAAGVSAVVHRFAAGSVADRSDTEENLKRSCGSSRQAHVS